MGYIGVITDLLTIDPNFLGHPSVVLWFIISPIWVCLFSLFVRTWLFSESAEHAHFFLEEKWRAQRCHFRHSQIRGNQPFKTGSGRGQPAKKCQWIFRRTAFSKVRWALSLHALLSSVSSPSPFPRMYANVGFWQTLLPWDRGRTNFHSDGGWGCHRLLILQLLGVSTPAIGIPDSNCMEAQKPRLGCAQ